MRNLSFELDDIGVMNNFFTMSFLFAFFNEHLACSTHKPFDRDEPDWKNNYNDLKISRIMI